VLQCRPAFLLADVDDQPGIREALAGHLDAKLSADGAASAVATDEVPRARVALAGVVDAACGAPPPLLP